MLAILKAYGIPEEMVMAISIMYEDTTARVITPTPDGETETFNILACIDSSAKDLKIKKALAWKTCHQMRNIWKSTLSRKMKLRLMHTTVESVLLYGYETWTLTKILLKQLDGIYTRILRMILNVHWSQKVTTV